MLSHDVFLATMTCFSLHLHILQHTSGLIKFIKEGLLYSRWLLLLSFLDKNVIRIVTLGGF